MSAVFPTAGSVSFASNICRAISSVIQTRSRISAVILDATDVTSVLLNCVDTTVTWVTNDNAVRQLTPSMYQHDWIHLLGVNCFTQGPCPCGPGAASVRAAGRKLNFKPVDTTEQKMSCTICIETFNKTSRKEVTCDFCSYSACTACVTTYILGSSDLPHCMNCKKEWSRKVLLSKFTKNFVNTTLKTHREKIFFEREKALLPATQPLVERILRREEITRTIESLKLQISNLHREFWDLSERGSVEVEKKQFVRACPNNDCRGFLSTQWKCSICTLYTCSECHSLKGPNKDSEHTCVPEDILSAQLLAKDTKTCPKCACLIHKIDGCDQMWCIQCHTAFNWRTGRIETGAVHNPEYFRWLRDRHSGQLDRNPLDIQCGREIDYNFVDRLSTLLPKKSAILAFVGTVIHIRDVIMPRYPADGLKLCESLRIDYLRNKISEDKFKCKLQRHAKAMEKNREILGVLGMFVSCATDIIYRYYNELTQQLKLDTTDSVEVISELAGLSSVTDGFLIDISAIYGTKVPLIKSIEDPARWCY